jgi:hypothetical protein
MAQPITDTILMIRPVRFGYNEQTAGNNAFQQAASGDQAEAIQQAALAEFDAFVEVLRAAGVRVLVFEDRRDAPLPDSIFPNNWFSTHPGGLVLLYPMYAPNRRAERRMDIVQELASAHGFPVDMVMDLSPNEAFGRYLEGTGSMVLDRSARVVYACLSPRTDALLLRRFAETLGYGLQVFQALDSAGQPVYHTNVVMHIGSRLAVICLEAIPETQRNAVQQALEAGGKTVMPISLKQMNHFAGNMLEVQGRDASYTVMSRQALEVLHPPQRAQIESFTPILASPLDTIERHGGGSARCMMAEVFLGSAVQ